MLLAGCGDDRADPETKHARLRIKREGGMYWTCRLGSDTDVNIKGYVFDGSRGTELAFEKMSRLSEESVQRARRLQASAPTAELRESYAQEIKEYEEGLHPMGVGKFPGWEMILILPISMDAETGTKVLCVGRIENARRDIAFKISSPREVQWPDVKAVCRAVTAEVLTVGSGAIENSMRSGRLFDEKGSLETDEFREFVKGMGFPRQH